jgi:hypothetical protein
VLNVIFKTKPISFARSCRFEACSPLEPVEFIDENGGGRARDYASASG